MRFRGTAWTLLLTAACACAQDARAPGRVAVIVFDDVWGAWSTLRESSFGRKLAASGWLDRVGVNRHRAQVRAALVQAETHLGMPLAEPLSEVLRGKGALIIAAQDGAAVFALELAPAGAVPFRALLDRLIARDAEIVRAGEETVGGRVFERIRTKGKEVLVRIEANRLLAGNSAALLAAAYERPAPVPGAGLQVRYFPGNARALPAHRDDPELPIAHIDCALKVTAERVELAGAAQLTDATLLAPFVKVDPEPSGLLRFLPEGGMAFAALRVDFKELHALVERAMPPAERELFRRRVVGFSYTALGGRMLPEVLAGLGPEVVVAVAGTEGGAEPVAFTFLTPIRTGDAREAMHALGRVVYGVAALERGDARKDEGERCSIFTGKVGELNVTFGIRDDLLCVSTSEAMAKTVCAATAAAGNESAAAHLKGHAALSVDTAALAAWLRRNKAVLSARPTWQQGFRRPDEIEAAAEFSSVLSGASFSAVARGTAVEFSVGFDFAKP
jgi:hypothetical protein